MANLVQIIKYEGDNSTFVWKSPIEDFNTGSQLIVHESQEAVFFLNGQALDLFGPGRHTLETQNIPLLKNLLNKPTNDQTPFHCEVYYVNKTEQMSIKWGTNSQVQYMEPTYRFPLKIGASGEMSLRVENSRQLLIKIVGTEKSLRQDALVQMFQAFLMTRIKPYLAQTMQRNEFGIFEVDSHMGELSDALHKQLFPDFMEYGLTLERFFVTTIAKPDGEKAYEELKDIHIRQYSDIAKAQLRQQVGIIDQQTDAQRMVVESAAIAQKRAQEGYSYQQERGFDVAEQVAQNEGIGNFSSTGIGLGMMGGVAGGMGAVVAGITNNALNPLIPQPQGAVNNDYTSPVAGFATVPPVIDLKNEESTYIAHVTSSPASETDDMAVFRQKLEKLNMMKDMDMLSDDEFETERKKLLANL